ncbi:sensor kinase CusS [mine drainage metagenome]|uniref:histidine kinase n=1 Tax=mine drainage metagenome TaxID=410659 RepID=A0A1J5R1Y3_9ZZZZ
MPADAVRRPISLALRVTVLVGLSTTLLLLAFAWGVERSIELHFARMDLDSLATTWRAVDAALQLRDPAQRQHRLRDAVGDRRDLVLRVSDASGRMLFASDGPQLPVADSRAARAPALDALQLWQAGGHSWRGVLLRAPGGERVVLARAIDFHLSYLDRLRSALWAGTLLASLISVLLARLAVQQGNAPLRRISARMRDIGSEHLDARIDPAQVPVELADLVAAFNAMLERIERGYERLRGVSVDIAHELRTPVTNLRTQTQVALSRARPVDAYREVLYSNLEEFERMSAMISDMLFLAQSEHAQPAHDDVELAAEVRALFEYFEAWADEQGVALRLHGDARVCGDRAMLRRALSNLLRNAVHHSARGAAVEVTLAADAQRVRVEVCNTGAAIAPQHLPHLFERFYRADPSRRRNGEGAGLGLAIVKSIVEMHRGTVAARSADGLTCFSIEVPAPRR